MELGIPPPSSIIEIKISREGKHICVFKNNFSLSVYCLQSASGNEIGKSIWEADNVRSVIWHHEEPRLLLSKRNGDLESKLFRRQAGAGDTASEKLMAEHFLKHLILKRLDFESLKHISCLSFQRDYCILQTSPKQIAALQWSEQGTDIIWALEVGEFAQVCFCDRNFVNFEPHTKNLHVYNLFEGKIKHAVELEFSDSLATSPVRQISASPHGEFFALLTDQLLVGTIEPHSKTKLEILIHSGKSVVEISIGTTNIAVLTRQPGEYHLFSSSSLQKVFVCPVPVSDIVVLAQRFDRPDKIVCSKGIRDLQESANVNFISIDVLTSLLRIALDSHNLESAANVLKIAEHGSEDDFCRIVQELNTFFQESSQSRTKFGRQVLGLGLGFAGRAFKKFPHCAALSNVIFPWQELFTGLESAKAELPIFRVASEEGGGWLMEQEMDSINVLKWALINNQLALGQQILWNRGETGFRFAKRSAGASVQTSLFNHIQHSDFDESGAIDEAESLMRRLACDVRDSWESMCYRADIPGVRDKIVEILHRRHAIGEDLANCLKYLKLIESSTPETGSCHNRTLTLTTVSEWGPETRRLYLAELFLERPASQEILDKITPEDVWFVMLNKQNLCHLKKWIAGTLDQGDVPFAWEITSRMVDIASECTHEETRDCVLNWLACFRGMFSERERHDLKALVGRLLAINRFELMKDTVYQSGSNITLRHLQMNVVDFCAHHYHPALFYDFAAGQQLELNDRPVWMGLIAMFHCWNSCREDATRFADLCNLNSTFLGEENLGEFWLKHPFVTVVRHWMDPSSCRGFVGETLKNLLVVNSSGDRRPVVLDQPSVYQLIAGEIPVNVDRFFRLSLANTNAESLSCFYRLDDGSKYTSNSTPDWACYLRQSRPFRAYFTASDDGGAPQSRFALCPFVIQSVCMENPFNASVSTSSVLLLEMLGCNSQPVQLTLAVLDRVAQVCVDREPCAVLEGGTVLTDVQTAQSLRDSLETALLDNPENLNTVTRVEHWRAVVEFCSIYDLDVPVRFLHDCASHNDWLAYLLFVQRYGYSWMQCRLDSLNFLAPLKEHLQFSMRSMSGQSPSSESIDRMALYRLLLCGHSKASSHATGFQFPTLTGNSGDTSWWSTVIVLTAVLQEAKVFDCLCLYLCSSLAESGPIHDRASPNPALLNNLIATALMQRRLDMVLEAFHIFVPNHVLTGLLDWLHAFSNGVACTDDLQRCARALLVEDHLAGNRFFQNWTDVLHLAMQIFTWYLKNLSQELQVELLALWADIRPFDAAELLVCTPDFALMAEIAAICLDAGIDLDASILMQGNLQAECQQVVEVLLQRRHLSTALKLAELAGLPSDTVFVTQLSTQLENESQSVDTRTLRYRAAFWSRCNGLMKYHRVRADIAAHFFRNSLDRTLCTWESHLVASYALDWMHSASPPPTNCAAELFGLEVLCWQFRIEAELDGTAPPALDLQSNIMPPCALLGDSIANAAQWTDPRPKTVAYSAPFLQKASEWIDRYLDLGDIRSALKLSSMFSRKSVDLDLVVFLVGVVENDIDLATAKERLSTIVLLSHEEADWKDRSSFIEFVYQLLQHGHGLCQQLSVCYQVALTLDLPYRYVVEHPRPESIFQMLLITATPERESTVSPAIGSHVSLARSWANVSRIASADIVTVVRDQLIEAVRNAQGTGLDGTDYNMMMVSLLCGLFNRYVTLCSDSSLLGCGLLEAAQEMEQSSNSWYVAVELLIFAHSSFTLACDVENIRRCLNQTRGLINRLLLDDKFSLIARLFSGIERYTEMSYVFTILKEHGQFEYLLRKGMDRLPRLRLALMDFLRPSCAENRELFRLVALHFSMHAEVAAMWHEEANALLRPIVDQAASSFFCRTNKKSLMASPSSKTVESSPAKKAFTAGPLSDVLTTTVPMLKASLEIRKALSSAMQNLAHSAEYYLQAGKLNHANKVALQAELIALQIHLVNRCPLNSQVFCIVSLNPTQVNYLVTEFLTYPEAEIVSRSCDCPVAWGRALFRHYVLNNELDYLNKFARRHTITHALVEELVAVFETEPGSNRKGEVLDRLSDIISMLTDVETKYRIASRLGLRRFVGDVLASSSLPYLKDTAWGKKADQE